MTLADIKGLWIRPKKQGLALSVQIIELGTFVGARGFFLLPDQDWACKRGKET